MQGPGINLLPGRLFLDQVSRELLRNNSQIANQRGAVAVDVSRYLRTRKVVTRKRGSENSPI